MKNLPDIQIKEKETRIQWFPPNDRRTPMELEDRVVILSHRVPNEKLDKGFYYKVSYERDNRYVERSPYRALLVCPGGTLRIVRANEPGCDKFEFTDPFDVTKILHRGLKSDFFAGGNKLFQIRRIERRPLSEKSFYGYWIQFLFFISAPWKLLRLAMSDGSYRVDAMRLLFMRRGEYAKHQLVVGERAFNEEGTDG